MRRNPLPLDGSNRFTGYTTIEQVERAFWSKVPKRGPDECWLWPNTQRRYGQFSAKRFPLTTLAHRWAFYFTHGRLPEPEVRHTCDNSLCCNPAHLMEGTRQQNEDDKTVRGRRPTGVKSFPCPKCGGPREGRIKRSRGREAGYCIPCYLEYQRNYPRAHSKTRVGQESP